VDAAGPDVLIVSLGFDTLAGDPHGGLHLTPEVFRPIGRSLVRLGRPILLVQEGGYQLGALRPGRETSEVLGVGGGHPRHL